MILLALVLLWLAGFLVVAGRALYGYANLWSLGSCGSIPFPHADLDADALARRMGHLGLWELRECATREIAVPMTWGLFRPIVMLPCDAHKWSKSRLETVILHELAHVGRCDFAKQALAEFACALFWFNPFVWMAAGALRSHVEEAADLAVIYSGMRPSDYASELLQIAAELGRRRLPAIYVGTPAMRNSKIEPRLHAILSPRSRTGRADLLWLLALLPLAGIGLGVFGTTYTDSKWPYSGEREEARSRLKQVALATILYANDWDDIIPYVQDMTSLRKVLRPYVKDKVDFQSPAPGGRFLFNFHLGGVECPGVAPNMQGVASTAGAVPSPSVQAPRPELASTPMWYESLPDPTASFAVADADGETRLSTDRGALEKGLHPTFHRGASSHPLPKNYGGGIGASR